MPQLRDATTAAIDALRARLAAAAARVEETRAAYDLAVEQRNAAVVDAIDGAGMAQGAAAKLCGVSQPHIVRILAKGSQVPA